MPPPEHLRMGDRMPGTVWRTVRPVLLMVLVVGIVFALFSIAVAITTADKCGDHFNASKDWNYFPPRWDCTVTITN
jgi:hypothetical protein